MPARKAGISSGAQEVWQAALLARDFLDGCEGARRQILPLHGLASEQGAQMAEMDIDGGRLDPLALQAGNELVHIAERDA